MTLSVIWSLALKAIAWKPEEVQKCNLWKTKAKACLKGRDTGQAGSKSVCKLVKIADLERTRDLALLVEVRRLKAVLLFPRV